jgi:hypothetical protein
MTDTRGRMLLTNRWQDWANLVLGVWLFLSPWILGFAARGEPTATVTTAASNAWIFGVIIAVLSIAALARAQPWEEWINLLCGIWLVISPWVLGYSANMTPLWNALIVGVLVFIMAVWDLSTMPGTSGSRA